MKGAVYYSGLIFGAYYTLSTLCSVTYTGDGGIPKAINSETPTCDFHNEVSLS
jgi:hypothetical protein